MTVDKTWGQLDELERDYILADHMEWAWAIHHVELKLLARGEHVAICELIAIQPGQGRVRKVMQRLCQWADHSHLPLELTPSNQWGADPDRLVSFYTSLGFQPNREPRTPMRVQEELIRYPIPGQGHDPRHRS